MLKIKFFLPDESDEANDFMSKNGNANGTIAFTTNGIYVTYEDGVYTKAMKNTILFNKINNAKNKSAIVEADLLAERERYNIYLQEVTDLKEKISNNTDKTLTNELKSNLRVSEDALSSSAQQIALHKKTLSTYQEEITSCEEAIKNNA